MGSILASSAQLNQAMGMGHVSNNAEVLVVDGKGSGSRVGGGVPWCCELAGPGNTGCDSSVATEFSHESGIAGGIICGMGINQAESQPPTEGAGVWCIVEHATMDGVGSVLSSGVPSPFGTLRRRVQCPRRAYRWPRIGHQKDKYTLQQHNIVKIPTITPRKPTRPVGPILVHRHPTGIAQGKPFITIPRTKPVTNPPEQHLDWDQNPWLQELSRALEALSWARIGGGQV